jgi:peptide/nickel transport system permease protein
MRYQEMSARAGDTLGMGVSASRILRLSRPRTGEFARRFAQNRAALVSAIVLLLLVLMVIFAGQLAPYDPLAINLAARLQAPSAHHLLGTDDFGRDQLSRMMYGGRASLSVAFGAMAISVAAGLAIGMQAGFMGRAWDAVLMRFTDAVMAFPTFFLVVAVAAIAGPSILNVTLIIGLTSWPIVARLIRGEVLSLKQRDYVTAARVSGASPLRIMRSHMIPNVLPVLIVASTLQVAAAILTEAMLSFLGLGVTPPQPSWGNMLSVAQNYLFVAPWTIAAPAAAIVVTVLCLNFVGDGLREAADVRLRSR